MSKNAEKRQQYQIDFIKGGQNIEVGKIDDLPINITDIESIDKDSKYVIKYFGGGLTSEVFKL
ncbi:MAG TPA: phosphotransferase, partial [Spirochaetota bacterium]|nr:phosphotransferase [Spirochaetota bacterium]